MEALGINQNFLIAHVINFVLMMLLLRRYLYRPILSMFEQRRERIREGLEEAERVREEAAQARTEYERQLAEERARSQAALREAAQRSEEARERIVADAKAEAERILREARERAEQEHRAALVDAQGQIAELAVLGARKIIQDGLDEQRQRQLVRRFLSEQLGELA